MPGAAKSLPPADPGTRRALSKDNPYALLPTSKLAAEAKRLEAELLAVCARTPEERLALADRTAHMLVTCSEPLDKLRWASRGSH